jgi:hypothetical protein
MLIKRSSEARYLHATTRFETSIQEHRYAPIATTAARLSTGATGEAARATGVVPRVSYDIGARRGGWTRVAGDALQALDLMKVDVLGAELRVLSDAGGVIRKGRRALPPEQSSGGSPTG